ncbi:MAG: DnaB-like helicase N-terminal domain-containing protein, partial [Sphaerochaetaceae bacterium]|nr:DnaB-like helicase N-terminal domain-containing protein [Sphaerochaetaceae bacterium]
MASNYAGGRIPPHNDDAERAVLGAIMLSANAFSEVTEVLRKEDFYKPGHLVLFDAI